MNTGPGPRSRREDGRERVKQPQHYCHLHLAPPWHRIGTPSNSRISTTHHVYHFYSSSCTCHPLFIFQALALALDEKVWTAYLLVRLKLGEFSSNVCCGMRGFCVFIIGNSSLALSGFFFFFSLAIRIPLVALTPINIFNSNSFKAFDIDLNNFFWQKFKINFLIFNFCHFITLTLSFVIAII